MPDLIWLGSEALDRNGPDDSCTLSCFQTRFMWPKPDLVSQNRIRSGLFLYNMIWAACGRMQLSLFLETRPDDSCTLACFQTRCVCPKLDKAVQLRSGSLLHNLIWAFFGKTEPSWMQEVGSGMQSGPDQLHAGRNGHNWQ